MSPILTRPIREQFEHDRVIRLLQARYKRKHDVAINPGGERNEAVMAGELEVYPDLLLFSTSRGRALEGTVEVETVESVNQLEALAEWGTFGRLPVPLHLYVPPQALESAKRMCKEHGFLVSEIWTYHMAIDQVRFTLAHKVQVAHVVPQAPPKVLSQPAVAKVALPKAVEPKPVATKPGAVTKAKAPAPAPAPVAKSVVKLVAKPVAKPVMAKKVVAKPPVKAAARKAPTKAVAAKPAPKAVVKKSVATKKAVPAARKPPAKKRR